MADETVVSARDAAARGGESYCPACNRSYPPHYRRCPEDGAVLVQLAAQRDTLVGRVLEQRFEVIDRLGEGGMGAVYRGRQLSVDRVVAIKVIDVSLARDRTAVKRFLREAKLSSKLQHPAIVHVFDFGQTEDGLLYLVMELLRGRTLGAELDQNGPLGVARTVAIAEQMCDALEHAHAQGIIHRDLKPGNVVVLDALPAAPADRIKVLDFGLAKSLVNETISSVTKTNAMLGTPLYMSPEQVEGRPSDQRSDFYALGCMLHEMLSGRPPFLDDTINGVLMRQLREAPPPLSEEVPLHVRTTVQRLLEKRPENRYDDVRQVRAALRGVEPAATAVTLRPEDPPPEVPIAPPRRAGLAIAGVIVAVCAIAVIVVAIVVPRGDRAATRDAAIAIPAARPIDAAMTVDARAVDAAPIADAAIDAPPPPHGQRPQPQHGSAAPVVIPVTPPPPPPPPPARPDAGLEFYPGSAK